MLPHDQHQGSENVPHHEFAKDQAKDEIIQENKLKDAHSEFRNSSATESSQLKDATSAEAVNGKQSKIGADTIEQASAIKRVVAINQELCFRFLVELQALVGVKRFDEWFAHQTTIHLTERVLFVCVTSPFLQRWMQRVFHKECQQVLLNMLGPGIVVEFQVREVGSSHEGLNYLELKNLLEDKSEQPAGRNIVINPERFGEETSTERKMSPANLPVTEVSGSKDDPAGDFSHIKGDQTAIAPSQKDSCFTRKPASAKPRLAYALETFVASQGNQELIHSARHLLQNNDQYFNGMYIYGGIGNGKTHILHGMYQLLRDPSKNLRVMYLTAEQFANYYIQALRDKSTPSFHHKFRQLDVLIVDDVEFLEGKHGIQEEFLRTLKQLENSRKRVIFSADRHPRSFLQTRSELIDRYLACLVKRIQEPDDHVRQQIVLQRACELDVSITTEVAEYLANRFRGSVRELIGAVNCLHAYYLVHQRRITLSTARYVLAELERACLRIIKPQDIEQVVCEFFQITCEELHSSSRARTLSLPRMIAMYLIRKHTTAAYTEIGRQFGGRNHSTVISAERKVEEWLTQDLTIKLEPATRKMSVSDQSWSIRDILQTLEQRLMAC